ncbi:alcohol dehydrogenase catalytic domain-containing protein [Streptomyces hoynatensis]|uniref:2-deoxy-scyllo-inosamine dehydrogenase n=1 Tax=Streptomyces hoynatensis TaxID=1141874 RepID=A0A3A9YXE7_9ACTN|nr:alcohol dehydrogenase catalytic domain-containing protein [Streptomyces hoynatensis]RKN40731.1 NAD(P)-dependent alcohol dehydrogenase [Streptomyces hoynatensis]
MRAVQYREIGAAPEVVTVPDPEPGPGQVLLRVTAAAACPADIALMSWPAESFPHPLPLTLGHEVTGTVAALGAGVDALAEGEAVALYAPQGCGRCGPCARGAENLCRRAAGLGRYPPGLGAPGGMAELLLVDDARFLLPLDGLDPVAAAPLTHAGLGAYHAVKRSLPRLVAGGTAVVIGARGEGGIAIRLLRALSPSRVIALETAPETLEAARAAGAHEALPADARAADLVRELTGQEGAAAVFDFAGTPHTVGTAGAVAAVGGEVAILGPGGGALAVGAGTTAFEVSVSAPHWGSRGELAEVLALARGGGLDVPVETYPLREAPLALERLHAGKPAGRPVFLPG